MQRTGTATLPLHYGSVPRWLFGRMVKLAEGITRIMVDEYGAEEFLKRLSDPFWFQSFSCVLGFDWHSSGTTTVTCGALKQVLNKANLGIFVAGGKGQASRRAPDEIRQISEDFSLSTKKTNEFVRASKLAAKVDNTAIQDNYQLYHHIFVLSEKGKWVVVQQGLNPENKYARRYHWLSDNVRSFVLEPHAAICYQAKTKNTLDMTSKKSKEAQKTSLDLVKDGPDRLKMYFLPSRQARLDLWLDSEAKRKRILELRMPQNINWKAVELAYELQPKNYENLLEVKGIGPATVRALALISELIYGSEVSWQDPAKFSFAHGGKDSVPFKINKKHYDTSIQTLQEVLSAAKLDNKEKLRALKRLSNISYLTSPHE
ncbi:MAG: DUF763 domain-containing protein [Thermoplasmatales archaeon]|nr:DUF763 domain-containing protein [Thermoplasmatales archaeon]